MRFFLIDRITRWEVNTVAEAVKNIAMSEDFFDDHFPRRPVMPGVLLVEGMAQLAGLLAEASLKAQHARDAKAILTVLERTKFRAMIRPGDSLVYRAELLSVHPEGAKLSVQALREDRVVVTTAMVFAFKYLDDPLLDERRAKLLAMWQEPS